LVDFTEELFIDIFLNDEQRQYLQYFQANPTVIIVQVRIVGRLGQYLGFRVIAIVT
jgi:hypothetical protein